MFFNILLVFINIIVIIFGYFFIKNKIEKKVVNKEVLNGIKKEVNSVIIQLNEATLTNISLLEEKIKNLDKKIILADKKAACLKTNISKKSLNNSDLLFDNQKNFTYSPQKVVKQSQKATEKVNRGKKIINNTLEQEIQDLPIIEKASCLLKKGWELKDIQREVGLSSGELELLVNIQDMVIVNRD